ncbi:unnamed protein product [Ambrosiozyma monospora]|uniref:Peptidyl-prolyl cis-trans isomerase n=1 Tax=Ambrosiozyma monospora TaxID=43982 RepID=A0A9W7DDY6_AMBMO|nr:unnamed protein product [Ambrosiozyma monospora]
MSVLIETSSGNIVVDLFVEKSPEESFNFLKLCKSKYYHYSPFTNIQKDFIVETGNPKFPQSPTENCINNLATGWAKQSKSSNDYPCHDDIGLISFLKKGRNKSFEPQFILTLTDDKRTLKVLDHKATVFGKVSEGINVLNAINTSPVDEHLQPLKDIRILHTFVLQDPFPDPSPFNPPQSPFPTEEQIDSFRLLLENGSDDDIDSFQKKESEAKSISQTLTLELLGDLPTSNIKPSEKVLFICKLNPITTGEDLKLIFSRFGDVQSVEIIRDKETGASLCYGFIQFKDKKSVEVAYLKMDNTLIDDRRVHVDFSQSVKHRNHSGDQTTAHGHSRPRYHTPERSGHDSRYSSRRNYDHKGHASRAESARSSRSRSYKDSERVHGSDSSDRKRHRHSHQHHHHHRSHKDRF